MDFRSLKEEAKKLIRPAELITSSGRGDPVAWYFERPVRGVKVALQRRGTILLVKPNGKGGGRVETVNQEPDGGIPLYSNEIASLPPIEAVFLGGSCKVGDWLAANNWERSWGYNDNFGEAALVAEYEAWWQIPSTLVKASQFSTDGISCGRMRIGMGLSTKSLYFGRSRMSHGLKCGRVLVSIGYLSAVHNREHFTLAIIICHHHKGDLIKTAASFPTVFFDPGADRTWSTVRTAVLDPFKPSIANKPPFQRRSQEWI